MLKIPKNSAKNLNFWFIFGSFPMTPSYALAVAPQCLCQMKGLIEVHNRGKFHLYSICGCEVIKFQMFSWWGSIHEMAHSGEVLGPNSPKKGRIRLKFLPEVVLKNTKTVFQESLINRNFYQNRGYPKFARLVWLSGQFTPWRWPKSGKIIARFTKIKPSGYPNLSTPTP